jgi:hypothetical protein
MPKIDVTRTWSVHNLPGIENGLSRSLNVGFPRGRVQTIDPQARENIAERRRHIALSRCVCPASEEKHRRASVVLVTDFPRCNAGRTRKRLARMFL